MVESDSLEQGNFLTQKNLAPPPSIPFRSPISQLDKLRLGEKERGTRNKVIEE